MSCSRKGRRCFHVYLFLVSLPSCVIESHRIFMRFCRKLKADIFKNRGVTEETEQLWKSKPGNHLHRLGQDLNNQEHSSASLNSYDILIYTMHLLPNVLVLGMLQATERSVLLYGALRSHRPNWELLLSQVLFKGRGRNGCARPRSICLALSPVSDRCQEQAWWKVSRDKAIVW